MLKAHNQAIPVCFLHIFLGKTAQHSYFKQVKCILAAFIAEQ